METYILKTKNKQNTILKAENVLVFQSVREIKVGLLWKTNESNYRVEKQSR